MDQQPTPPQPPAPPQAPPAAQPQPPVPQTYGQENPGQTLGIISIIMPFVGLSVVGIVVGAIARSKSKAVGAPTTTGTIGMVISIVLTLVGIAIVAILFLFAALGTQRVQERAAAAKGETNARTVQQKAELYYVSTAPDGMTGGAYPATVADFAKYPESTLDGAFTVSSTMPRDDSSVYYKQCSSQGAQVAYFDTVEKQPIIYSLGDASTTKLC